MTKPVFIYCTVPDKDTASAIGKKLVEARLAACVSFGSSVQSIYRWEGNIEEAAEYVLTIKTVSENYSRIENLIVSLHPYDVPEIVQVDMSGGLQPYLEWIAAETNIDRFSMSSGQHQKQSHHKRD